MDSKVLACRWEKDEALEAQLRFEVILSNIVARFVSISAEQMESAILDAQRNIGEALGIDRSSVQLGTGSIITSYYSWNRPEVPKLPTTLRRDAYPWQYETIMRGEAIHFSNLCELPPEASADKETHRRNGLKSHACFPLKTGGKVFGSLSFGVLREERQWSEQVLNRLRLVADVFASALARKSAEQELQGRLIEIECLKEQLERDNLYLRKEIKLLFDHEEIVGESLAMRQTMAMCEQVAPMDSTVLVHGETGTGKELLARAIHRMSKRKDRLLVTVNCASLPPSLIEGEIFGREKGAYTGALTMMAGRFETADRSSLFLDEIGELPFEIQSKLLRVLETGRFERLGSSRTIQTDVRLIAATNRDLEDEVKKGKFRKDLYYRLNVFPIKIPPLRDRAEDIIPLVWSFVREYEKKMGKQIESIPKRSMDALMRYSWPGNVRELRNIIERAMIVSKDFLNISVPNSCHEEGDLQGLKAVERAHILRVLKGTEWRIAGRNGAAELLGMKRTTLNAKMKALNIKRPPSQGISMSS